MPQHLIHLAHRIGGQPLAITGAKLGTIMAVLGDRIGLPDARAALDDEELFEHLDSPARSDVALIPVVGTLVHRALAVAPPSGLRSYGAIGRDFQAALDDRSVRQIVLDIDSPGGECSGMLELAEQITAARGRKPIWAIVDEQATSAAYLVASAADPGRVLIPSTGTLGSIGVMAIHVDESARDQQEGRAFTTLTSGERKDDGNPHAPLDDEARRRLQAEVDRVAGLLFEAVARNRGVSADAIRRQQAALFHGRQAVEAGLADRLETPQAGLEQILEGRLERSRPALSFAEARRRDQAANPHLMWKRVARRLNDERGHANMAQPAEPPGDLWGRVAAETNRDRNRRS